jgi:hypothetical protein
MESDWQVYSETNMLVYAWQDVDKAQREGYQTKVEYNTDTRAWEVKVRKDG